MTILISLFSVYRPPSYPLVQSQLLEYMSKTSSLDGNFHILCGAFNCPDVSWRKNGASCSRSPIVEWAMNNFMSQHVSVPTRPDSCSVLDLVFSSVTTVIEKLQANECFGSSDHVILTFNVCVPSIESTSTSVIIPVFSKAKWKVYRSILHNSFWPSSSSLSVNDVWNMCIGTI